LKDLIMNNTTPQSKNISRRDFGKLAIGALGGLVAIEAAIVGFGYAAPRVGEGQFGSVITCGQVTEFPNGSVTPFNEGRFYLVRLQDGGFLALYRKCTHLGCAVPWDAAKSMFVCPCHASEFDDTGALKNPPAPRPLDLFKISIEGGAVKVDTGTPIQRDHYDPSQVVYA
jgi:cytochrome b6-f complex iron-sulfur subunit